MKTSVSSIAVALLLVAYAIVLLFTLSSQDSKFANLDAVEWSQVFLTVATLLGALKIADAIQDVLVQRKLEKLRAAIDLKNSCTHGIAVIKERQNAEGGSKAATDDDRKFEKIYGKIIQNVVLPELLASSEARKTGTN